MAKTAENSLDFVLGCGMMRGMTYNIGDKVWIRDDVQHKSPYRDFMAPLIGKIGDIKYRMNNVCYVHGFWWHSDSLKPVGYHTADIPKGELGKLSKIEEELKEARDAELQGSRIMLLVELSDLYGALEAVAVANGSSMEELSSMSAITKRAFASGERI